MRTTLRTYIIGWALLLGLFNLIAFIFPAILTEEKYTVSFWIGYGVITAAFIGQLVCACLSLRSSSPKRTFYNLSLFSTSLGGLMATFVVGILCMLIAPLPYWVGAIICPVILVFNIIAALKAGVAISIVERVDREVAARTFTIRSLTADAEALIAEAGTEELVALCNTVYDAIRYSDPMSADELNGIENDIELAFSEFATAIRARAEAKAQDIAKSLTALIKNRNARCRLLK